MFLSYLGGCQSIIFTPFSWNLVFKHINLLSKETNKQTKKKKQQKTPKNKQKNSARYSPFLFNKLGEQNL